MERNYRKQLYHVLRMAVYTPGNGAPDDAALLKAMTVNENLHALGLTLRPEDIARLAVSPDRDQFYDRMNELADRIKVNPMYPGFPNQVMRMSEAQLRFHQMLHYFSTYGLEGLFGEHVSRGWLPEYKGEERVCPDMRLLKYKVLELVPEEDAPCIAMKRILERREKMTENERALVKDFLPLVPMEFYESCRITFKKNLLDIFLFFFDTMEVSQAFHALHGLCRHTGDVLKCMDYVLTHHHFHLRTSQKRLAVKLLESYPVSDFKANVILSNKKAKRSLLVLQYMDYSTYSRSREHMAVVDALRDGSLHSWESQVKALLTEGDDSALVFIGRRPGMLLRMSAWLIRLGYDEEQICKLLCEHVASLSVQTLVTVLTHFGKLSATEHAEADKIYAMLEKVLINRLSIMNTELAGKRVYIDEGGIDLEHSVISCAAKAQSAGYMRNGIAFKIPENVSRLRFFVYWNDEQRVDVDLHGSFITTDGEAHHIGWNGDFRDAGLVFSGDITHSNAAEYIDVDLNRQIREVALNIHLYYGRKSFAEVKKCFVGVMAVGDLGENVALYNPANCFFSHELRDNCRCINYGRINVTDRVLTYIGEANERGSYDQIEESRMGKFSTKHYLTLLLKTQKAELVRERENADVVLVMGKASDGRERSILDHNYFMDAGMKSQEKNATFHKFVQIAQKFLL